MKLATGIYSDLLSYPHFDFYEIIAFASYLPVTPACPLSLVSRNIRKRPITTGRVYTILDTAAQLQVGWWREQSGGKSE